MRSNKRLYVVVWLTAGYIALQTISDISAVKIVSVFGITVPAAVFLYTLCFTWIDLINDYLGRSIARRIVVIAALINLFMAAYFKFTIAMKPAEFWALQKEYSSILGGVWRIVIASIVAEVANTILDVEIFHFWKVRVAQLHTITGWRWVRVVVSNACSVTLDSIVFVTIAFLGTFSNRTLLSIITGQIIIKGIISMLSIPLIYAVGSVPVKRLTE
ncbi:queuosine precursor transporter [Candidatus Zixiibacteriota bacterium]